METLNSQLFVVYAVRGLVTVCLSVIYDCIKQYLYQCSS